MVSKPTLAVGPCIWCMACMRPDEWTHDMAYVLALEVQACAKREDLDHLPQRGYVADEDVGSFEGGCM